MTFDTFFLNSKSRLIPELKAELDAFNENPFSNRLMDALPGFVSILDENRHILSMSDSFLKEFGINNFHEMTGAFPGDVFGCVYAKKSVENCGNTKYCSTCGAGIAIKTCLNTNEDQEKICALKQSRNGMEHDFCFKVKCSAVFVEDKRFLVLFIEDITKSYINSYLEKIFFHDLNNIISGLYGLHELFKISPNIEKNIERLENITLKLKNEIDAQRFISKTLTDELKVNGRNISVNSFLDDLALLFESHPAARVKMVEVSKGTKNINFYSDYALLNRVIVNMIINALEASEAGDTVQVWTNEEDDKLIFNVWNRSYIPEEVKLRVFQKFFTTKNVEGRGLGTFSMKLFGEKFLKGKVDFESSKESGTRFWISLSL